VGSYTTSRPGGIRHFVEVFVLLLRDHYRRHFIDYRIVSREWHFAITTKPDAAS